MARKKKIQKKESPNFFSFYANFINFWKEERTKFFIGVGLLIFALFAFIAFTSYLFSWQQDQSVLFLNFSDFYFNADIVVENWGGKAGALMANFFIYKLFGVASYGFVFLIFLMAMELFDKKIMDFTKGLKYTFTIAIWLSITLAFFFGAENHILGGANGYLINTWLSSLFGKTGTAFVLFLIFGGFILFTFDNALPWIKAFIEKIKTKKDIKEAFKETNIEIQAKLATETINKKSVLQAQKDAIHDQKIEEEKDTRPIDLDTNQPLEAVVKKDEFFLNDDGTKLKENIQATQSELGFEVNNTKTEEEIAEIQEKSQEEIQENEVLRIANELNQTQKLKLAVEKNQDVQLNEISQKLDDYDPKLDLSGYKLPPISLLEEHTTGNSEVTDEELISNKNKIVETLKNYKIEIIKIKATIGPTITLYEIIPAPGVRISKIKNLEDDIALSLSALGIRIIAPMPGRGTIGIEVPNRNPEIVSMRSVISSAKFQTSNFELPIAIGKTISNESYVVDLTKMPHLLVAGATGQGKSVGLNAIIASMLYKKHPSQVKFVLIDPKKVELTLYEKIERHYLATLPDAEEPIITDNQKVVQTLSSLNIEMDQRYDLLKKAYVRNIKEYNAKFIRRKLNPENGHRYLPYIVVIIDEFADLIMTAGKEIEAPIARIAQLARAVGIHLIVATQRPSTNIITGVIKANFPTRLAFKVASMIDSRTILDSPGANQLIGRGDMLITQGSDLVRLQCAFIDTDELDKITEFIGAQRGYPTPHLLPEYETEDGEGVGAIDLTKRDDLFDDAARLVVLHQQGSTSLIQRKLSIGYNRAGRIIDQLEAAGIVGPFEGSKARGVLYPDEYALESYLRSLDD